MMSAGLRRAIYSVAAVVAMSAAGCSEAGMDETMTEHQAWERVSRHIDRAVEAVGGGLSVELFSELSTECLDPTDNGPMGRVEVGRKYWLREISPGENRRYVDELYNHWLDVGYEIRTDDRESDNLFLSVEHPDDGFRMSVTENAQGDLSLGASSPCIWPNGTPEPEGP